MILLLLHLVFISGRLATVVAQTTSRTAGPCAFILRGMNCDLFPSEPICGSDDVEYKNHCAFAQAHCRVPSIHVKLQGPCPFLPSPSTAGPTTADPLCQVFLSATCPDDIEEVCASNNITYHNLCKYNQEQCRNPSLVIQYKGPCGVVTTVATTEQPTTGETTAETTQRPSTEMTTPQTTATLISTVDYVCLAFEQLQCGEEVEEVCGTDGQTYRNRCEYQKAKCKDPKLDEDLNGSCPTSAIPTMSLLCQALMQSSCDNTVKEICGSDGKTYQNECKFEKAQCSNPSLVSDPNGSCLTTTTAGTTRQLTVTLNFICQALVLAKCGNDTTEICGTDGRIYRNRCEFSKAVCYNPGLAESPSNDACVTTVEATTTTTYPTATLDFLCVAIVQVICGDEVKEICGSDGKTYKNQSCDSRIIDNSLKDGTCEFQKGKCYNPLVVPTKLGPCTTVTVTQYSTGATEKTTATGTGTTTEKGTGKVTTTTASAMVTTLYPPVVMNVQDILCATLMHYTCTDETDEACASNGVTYKNDCEYEKGKCTHRNLHVKYFGPCRDPFVMVG